MAAGAAVLCRAVTGTDAPEPAPHLPSPPDRRAFLAGAAALTAAVAAGCSTDGPTTGGSAAPAGGATGTTGRETAATSRVAPTTASTAPPVWALDAIEHVVIFMQENRTYDEYFGARPSGRGFADVDVVAGPDGRPIWYQPTSTNPDGFVLPFPVRSLTSAGQALPGCDHSWEGMHGAWNQGAMDGFAKMNGALAMPYYGRADLPYYWALADQFTSCDHFFCSVLGPTLPNRHMSMTGTIDPDGTLGGGPIVDNDGRGYRWETYPERLEKAGISWRIYHEEDDYDDNALKYYQRYIDSTPGQPLYDRAMANLPADGFEQDVASGNLPQVSWIVAPTLISEHPPFIPAAGEDYTARKIAALMAKPDLWAKTLFVLTYDESDGAFDHVVPPVPAADTPAEFITVGGVRNPIGLGMRVPTVLVGPFARAGAAAGSPPGRVVSTTFDHTSVLRLLEDRFGVEVPYLSEWRRSTCASLTEALDRSVAPDPTLPDLPGTVEHLAAVTDAIRSSPLPEVPREQVLPEIET